MLRAGFLALAALQTVGCTAAGTGVNPIIVVRVPILIELFAVHRRKEVWNRDVLRTALRAVMAGRAGNQM